MPREKRSAEYSSCTVKEVAAILAKSVPTIYDWISKGCPQNPDGTLSTGVVVSWYISREVEKYKDVDSLKDKKTIAEIERINAQIDKMKENNIDRSEHEQILCSRASSLRTFCEKSMILNSPKFVGLSLEQAKTRLMSLAEQMLIEYTGGD
jgi:predicted DNA-binding transcriptional regulator AlpA